MAASGGQGPGRDLRDKQKPGVSHLSSIEMKHRPFWVSALTTVLSKHRLTAGQTPHDRGPDPITQEERLSLPQVPSLYTFRSVCCPGVASLSPGNSKHTRSEREKI